MTSVASSLALTLLRVVSGALLLQHGLVKLIGFPPGAAPGQIPFDITSQMSIGAVIETVTGVLLILGLLTRVAALFASGLTAVAFWQFHYMKAGVIYPAANGGETAALFSFIFFYIIFAGPGALSLDSLFGKKK
jgi:putative oxidoreductase